MAKNDIGDWFQKEFWNELQGLRDSYAAFIHEFVDTKQARGYVRAQPSDFMVRLPGAETHFAEVKASEKHDSLKNCFGMVRDQQAAFARIWHEVGGVYTVWFYSEPRNVIQVWDGQEIARARAEGAPLSAPITEFSWNDLPSRIREVFKK